MYVHLHTHSPYSFLDGASSIEELVRQAALHGMAALAITDHNSLSAAVKFRDACTSFGIAPIYGVELTMQRGTHLTLLAQNPTGYSNLCQLITKAHAHGGRLSPALPWEELTVHTDGVICLSGCRNGLLSRHVRARKYDKALTLAKRLQTWFGKEGFFLELQDDWLPNAYRVCRELYALAQDIGAPVVATNNVHYATRAGFVLHDLLRCIAAGVTVDEVHGQRPLNSERYLKNGREMAELFGWCPKAVSATALIAQRCSNALPTPEEVTPRFAGDAAAELRQRILVGATKRYGGKSRRVGTRLLEEFNLITTLGYADYFLMVHDIVSWARNSNIRCTGRGSAADSCVAYCLGLTDVDVIERNLPFARFLRPGKIPDIDTDFPSSRRDEVFRHVVATYGDAHTAMACTFNTYWARGAMRDIGKALGLPADVLTFLREQVASRVQAHELDRAFDRFAELWPYKHLKDRFGVLFDFCGRLSGFPRHIGTHSSGIVVSRVPLAQIAPVEPSARGIVSLMELDKDDAEKLGLIKFDILALRTLDAVTDTERALKEQDASFSYDAISFGDEQTFRMMHAGKSMGVFQFESPAQIALATLLLPTTFEDLVASVALIRPGPVRGNVVGRFVAARNGWCRADVLHLAITPILRKTFGCLVYQEQVDQVVAAMTGMSEADADRFRKSLTRHAKADTMDIPEKQFLEAAHRHHPDLRKDKAALIWEQIAGWSGYGFLEGHAGSFALTGYRTAYLACHHFAEYFAAVMSNQPMGFYSNNSLAAEARRRGVQLLPVDINESGDKCEAQGDTIRLGVRLVAELTAEDVTAILAAREACSFSSILDFCTRVILPKNALENLILCGAFDQLHENRRELLLTLDRIIGQALAIRRARASGEPYLISPETLPSDTADMEEIADISLWEKFTWTWRITGVSAECHVFSHFREELAARGFVTTAQAAAMKHGTKVWVAGISIRPHRPPTRSGVPVVFVSIEDESDMLHGICVDEAIDTCTEVFLRSAAVIVEGTIERRGQGVSLKVLRAKPFKLNEPQKDSPRPVWAGQTADHQADRSQPSDQPQTPSSFLVGTA
jgi:error-prone DNA polymerase